MPGRRWCSLRRVAAGTSRCQARYAFGKATAAVDDCDGVRLHDLRHTCASLALAKVPNVKVVQKLLGHKSAVLTLDRYGHLLPDDLDVGGGRFRRSGPNYCGRAADGRAAAVGADAEK